MMYRLHTTYITVYHTWSFIYGTNNFTNQQYGKTSQLDFHEVDNIASRSFYKTSIEVVQIS